MATVRDEPGQERGNEATDPRDDPRSWIWARSGPGVPCCEAQADGFPCPELLPDCTRCALEMTMKEGRSGRLAPWLPANGPF